MSVPFRNPDGTEILRGRNLTFFLPDLSLSDAVGDVFDTPTPDCWMLLDTRRSLPEQRGWCAPDARVRALAQEVGQPVLVIARDEVEGLMLLLHCDGKVLPVLKERR